MLSPAEYLPDFLQFLRAPGPKSALKLSHCLVNLERRLNWELPLLNSFQEADSAISLLKEPIQELRLLLEQRPDSPCIPGLAGGVLTGLQRVQVLFIHLPRFTDIGVINDLIVLGARPIGPNREAVRLRLPLVLQWLESLELEWNVFLRLWPRQASLHQQAMMCIQAMRGGLGAIYLELLDEEPGGFKAGLTLLIEVLKTLEPIEETRFLEESRQYQFSPDLVLERAFHLLDSQGRLDPVHRPRLERWLSEQGHKLMHRHCQALVESAAEERIPPLTEFLARLSRGLESMDRSLLLEMATFARLLLENSNQ